MFNNEPYFQKLCINRNKSQNGDPSSDSQDEVSKPQNSEMKYAVGETVFTGKFNLKVNEDTIL